MQALIVYIYIIKKIFKYIKNKKNIYKTLVNITIDMDTKKKLYFNIKFKKNPPSPVLNTKENLTNTLNS